MYEQYFGLSRTPFRLEPEPDMFYAGNSQTRVLKCISNALKTGKSVITLSGLPGTGKTTVIRKAVEECITPSSIVTRINRGTVNDLLSEISKELSERLKSTDNLTLKEIIQKASSEKKHILIQIDEAQQITKNEIKTLYENIGAESNRSHYVKFLLVGHEDLDKLFDLSIIHKDANLLSEHCHMLPLKEEEITPYVEHRLKTVGWNGNPEFDSVIFSTAFKITKGVPRRVNSFFDRFLLHLYMASETRADLEIITAFCLELSNELEDDPHPDLDSSDLKKALRLETKEFEQIQTKDVEPPTVTAVSEAIKEKRPAPPISLVKPIDNVEKEPEPSTEKLAAPERTLTPVQKKYGQLILTVSNYQENPERFKHYSDEFYKLPEDIGILLFLAIEKDANIERILPRQLINIAPLEVRRMIRHFLKRVLFAGGSDPFRILGLQSSANEKQINQHFDYLMRICRSDVGGPSEWSKNEENAVKQAYIKILGANSPDAKSKKPVINRKKTTGNTPPKPQRDEQPLSTAQNAIAEQAAKKVIDEDEIPVVTHSIPKQPTKPIPGIQQTTEPAETDTKTKTHSPKNQFQLSKIPSRRIPWIPIALVFSIVGGVAIGVLLLGGNEADRNEAQQAAQLTNKPKADVAELKLLRSSTEQAANSIDQKPEVSSENRISKILAESNKPKPAPTPKPVAVEKPQITKKEIKPVKKVEAIEVARIPEKKVPEEKKKAPNNIVANKSEAKIAENKKPATKPPQRVSPTPNPPAEVVTALTDADLNRLIFYFKRSYESGDIDIFGSLFTKDAITNESENRAQIIRDYDALFEVTDTRSIELKNLTWKKEGIIANGSGTFILSIVEKEGMAPEEIRGEINIRAEKIENKAQIRELFYRYSFAAN